MRRIHTPRNPTNREHYQLASPRDGGHRSRWPHPGDREMKLDQLSVALDLLLRTGQRMSRLEKMFFSGSGVSGPVPRHRTRLCLPNWTFPRRIQARTRKRVHTGASPRLRVLKVALRVASTLLNRVLFVPVTARLNESVYVLVASTTGRGFSKLARRLVNQTGHIRHAAHFTTHHPIFALNANAHHY